MRKRHCRKFKHHATSPLVHLLIGAFSFGLVGKPEEGGLSKELKPRAIVLKSPNPETVTVRVSYNFGIGFHGYQFTFSRGNVEKGQRWAAFQSLAAVPSE